MKNWLSMCVVCMSIHVGCIHDTRDNEDIDLVDAGDVIDDAGIEYPAPNSNRVSSQGSVETVEFAAWNIENFPHTSSTMVDVADSIASMNVDIITLEEISSKEAFDELNDRLQDWDGVVSSHTYQSAEICDGAPTCAQKVALLYRLSEWEIRGTPELLFSGSGDLFPRPPLAVRLRHKQHTDFECVVVVVHLKATTDSESIERRTASIQTLAQYSAGSLTNHGQIPLMILGDFNETVDDISGARRMAPFLEAEKTFRVLTQDAAESGQESFIQGSGSFIDHIVVNTTFYNAFENIVTNSVRLQLELSNYETTISDHIPVLARMSWKQSTP